MSAFYQPPNRLAKYFPVEAPPPAPIGDKLLDESFNVKLEVTRFRDDNGNVDARISFEVLGQLDDSEADQAILAALLRQFRKPRGECEGAV
jgi:hypothetical protein